MMFPIISKKKLAEGTFEMKISAPKIARKAKAGQFVIIRIDSKGERIPLTIADFDNKDITLVFMIVGFSTEELSKLEKGDFLLDVEKSPSIVTLFKIISISPALLSTYKSLWISTESKFILISPAFVLTENSL